LSIASDTSDVTYSTLGVRASAALPFDATTSARLTGMIGWRHAYGSLTPTAQNAFAGGAPFTVAGVPVGEDVAVVSAGLAFDLGARPEMGIADATFSISYDGQFGSGVVDSAANARLTFKF
jgi:outer membrane autotransporter protein